MILMLWLTGGPGCPSITGLLYENGSIQFEDMYYIGSLPTLTLTPYSWTKMASILFLDSPVGTGFSYGRTIRASHSTDIQLCDNAYEFMRKWFEIHPEFNSNPFYVAGDSYSGDPVPGITQLLSDGNEAGNVPYINLKCIDGIEEGYMLEPHCREYHTQVIKLPTQKLLNEHHSVSSVYCPFYKHMWLTIGFLKPTFEKRYILASGDHDMIIPHHSTQAWIRDLNYSVTDQWRSWMVNGQVAGYTESYSNMKTFA
ncbi:hypothetical protein M8C21_023194, partial [Ambrosia artemisiifolia]